MQGRTVEWAQRSTCTGSEGVKALSRCLHQANQALLCLPQWSGEITAQVLDESAEMCCGEILIKPSKAARTTYQPLYLHARWRACRYDPFHLRFPRGGAAAKILRSIETVTPDKNDKKHRPLPRWRIQAGQTRPADKSFKLF